MKIIKTECLIIGSGPGGAVVANELTENNFECILVEEGKQFHISDSPIDNNISKLGEELQSKWRNGGAQFALGKHPISFSEACCYGGGSEINSGIYQEVSDELINKWTQKYKIDDFNSNTLNKFYSKIKSKINLVTETQNAGFPTKLINDISLKEGWSIKDLPRISKRRDDTIRDSNDLIRQSMSQTLLKKSQSNGLQLYSKIKIIKLNKKNNKIISAIGKCSNNQKYKFIAKNFFICCGAIQSPYLLKKSGITKNIGKFFRMHPTLRMIVKFPFELDSYNKPLPLKAITEFLPAVRLSGANFSLPILSSLVSEDWTNRKHILKDWKKTIILYVMINPEGYGQILNFPFFKEPIVRYKLHKHDFNNLSFGLQKYTNALFNLGAEEIIPCISNAKSIKSIDDIHTFDSNYLEKKRINLMSIHLFGSCIPGNNEKYCSTDSYGKINDYENIFICDSSQIPESTGVNPQATVMALSLRNIENFLDNS